MKRLGQMKSGKPTKTQVGNLIIGRITYDLMLEDKSLDELDDPFVIVLTSGSKRPARENTVFVRSFKEAINEAKKKGFNKVLVGGGGKMDRATLESGLIDYLCLSDCWHTVSQVLRLKEVNL